VINILIVTHGEFGAYLVEAAEEIVGRQESGVAAVSISSRLPVEEIRNRVQVAVNDLRGADGLIIGIDMPGGTPGNVCMPPAKDCADVSVVSGVNLYMLITAFNGRRQDTLEKLVEKMLVAGKRSVADVKEVFRTKAGTGA
jgi:PTS system mannose-specific IIA component